MTIECKNTPKAGILSISPKKNLDAYLVNAPA